MRGLTKATLLLLLAAGAAPAQQKSEDLPVTPADRARIIAGVAARLDSSYFDAERAALITRQLGNRKVRATYDSCATASCLTAALTRDLQAWGRDRHLRVVFSAQPRPLPKASVTYAEQTAQQHEQARARNFGLHAVERLTGNIGYLEIGRFDPAALAAPTFTAAMQFLANTDALIIDLRFNGGGHADMVAFVASHFLPEQTRLVTLQRRDPAASDQVWSAAWVPGPRFLERPVFVLTAARTFSGAEGLAYDLRHFAKATIVGEKTRGGANPGSFRQIDEHFAVFVPTARVVHAATGTNWDADGLAPDVAVPANEARHVARKLALETLLRMQPQAVRAPLWKEALAEMTPTSAN